MCRLLLPVFTRSAYRTLALMGPHPPSIHPLVFWMALVYAYGCGVLLLRTLKLIDGVKRGRNC
jgi:hypothetical protein